MADSGPVDGADGVDDMDDVDAVIEPDIEVIERVALGETTEGRRIAAAFVADFGSYMSETVRPVLREVKADGGEPQLLVNGLAELLRLTADTIEFPVGHER